MTIKTWTIELPAEADELHPDVLAVLREGLQQQTTKAIRAELRASRKRAVG